MKIIHLLMAGTAIVALSAGITGSASAAVPAVAASQVTVVPSTGLVGGDTVAVTGVGLTPFASVKVIQCDRFTGNPDAGDCVPRTTTTANSAGNVSLHVILGDPVYFQNPIGSPRPVYCRADYCRIYLAWNDQAGTQRVRASHTLQFKGSPATIHVWPATNLRNRQWVHVTGTVYGAAGHTLLIRERNCYAQVQGTGCDDNARSAVWTVVRPSGYYAAPYRVARFLSNSDCYSDPYYPGCVMNVTVLTNGKPDDSFGVSSYGQPAAPLTFQGG